MFFINAYIVNHELTLEIEAARIKFILHFSFHTICRFLLLQSALQCIDAFRLEFNNFLVSMDFIHNLDEDECISRYISPE